jgi:hypothetical protein
MSLEFRFANPDEYQLIAHFVNDHWAQQHIYCRSEKLFQWTFGRRAHWQLEGLSVAVALADGELAGILGGIPFTFNHFGNQCRGVWLANYVIRESARKGPAALRLLSMLRGAPFGATLAFGINPATANIYRVLKGQVFPLIPRHIAVLPDAVPRMAALLRTAHPDWTNGEPNCLAENYALSADVLTPSIVSNSLPEDWDEASWAKIAPTVIGAVRDRDYFEWRYIRHPQFQYRFIVVAEGPRYGLAVWRLETIHQAMPDGARKPVDQIARVVEFLPASEENAAALIGGLAAAIRREGAVGADYYGYHGKTRTMLNSLGFREASESDADRIPGRFQPLDGKGGNILSAGFLPPGVPACTLDPDCPWYWTKSDSDQDRPN